MQAGPGHLRRGLRIIRKCLYGTTLFRSISLDPSWPFREVRDKDQMILKT